MLGGSWGRGRVAENHQWWLFRTGQPETALQRKVSRWRTALAAPALLLVIYIGFFWKLTLTDQFTWLDSPDFANQVLPWYQFEAGEWHKGRFPIWDPYEWAGQSLIGQAQPGVAYPPNWILFLLPLDKGWIRQVYLQWYFVLIHYMGGLFCYLLCRDLKRSRPASLLAGTAFGITGWMGATEWPQMLNGGVWAPVVFLYLLRVVRGERPLVNGGLAGAFLGVAFLSGHHQIPIYITLASAGVWIYSFCTARGNRRTIFSAAVLFGVFLVLVSAIQMLPAYEYGRLSHRWVGAREPVGWDTPVPYTVHSNFAMFPTTLIGMVIPTIVRNASAYVTAVVVALGFLAVVSCFRERMVRVLAAVALGGLLFSLAQFAVIHGVIYALIPMVEKARSASFGIFIFHFGIIVLIAFGIDTYLDIDILWIRRVILTLLILSGAILLAELVLGMTHVEKALDLDRIAAGAYYGLLLAALLYAWRRGHLSPRASLTCLVLLLALQAGLETGFSWPHRDRPSEYLKKMSENSDIVAFLRAQLRFVRLEVNDQEIPYNFNDWHGIDTFNGYLASLVDNVGEVQGDYRARMMAGANFWIGSKPLRENQQQLFVGASGIKVYSNPEAFPESWIVHQAVGIAHKAVLDNLQKYDLSQLRRLTFVRDVTPPVLEKCAASDWSEVTVRTSQRVRIEAALSCTGMVILDDAYYPGWVATVDGRSAPIYEAYGFLRGVVAPAGRHRIEMRYRPKSVIWGAILSGLGVAGACVLSRFGRQPRAT